MFTYLRLLHPTPYNVIRLKLNNTGVAEYDQLLSACLKRGILYESANLYAMLNLYTLWICLGHGLY